MPAARREAGDHPLLILALLFVLAAQMVLASRLESPVFDEPAHIGAGFSYLETGEFKVNLQHPPLLKEIGALPLVLIGARWPMSAEEWASLGPRPSVFFQWQLGQNVIFSNDPDRVMFWSRLPFIALTVMLGALLVAWGRKMLGGTAAVGALVLFALDPSIVAHGPLVTTDVGFAAFAVLFLFALWSYLEHRSVKRLAGCGVALGAALATKFSALILLPLLGLLALWATRWIPAAVPRRPSTLADPYASEDGGARIVWSVYAVLAMLAVAAIVINALYFFPRNPFLPLYWDGMKRVNADHDPSYWPYMAGEFRPRFWTYYFVTYLLKEPVAGLILTGLGLFAILRRGAATTMDRAFILLPPALLFLSYTVLSHDLGFRYVIPALPFLHLAGGAGLAWLLKERGAWGKACAAALCAWLVAAAAGIYPDHLPYFNELACALQEPARIGRDGGTACGPLWLDDSNVDWGQGIKQLKGWVERNAPGETVQIAYFGSVRPELYGLSYERLSMDELMRPPAAGLYVVSAHFLARGIGELAKRYGDGPGNWLLRTRPSAVVAHAYYVYDARGAPAR